MLPPKRLNDVDTEWLRFNLSSDVETSKEKAVLHIRVN